MRNLEQYYDGEDNWYKFSSVFGDDWFNSDYQRTLLNQLENRLDLAKVIYYHFDNSSLEWINETLPILDGLSPIECLKSKETENRLKVCLMRMH